MTMRFLVSGLGMIMHIKHQRLRFAMVRQENRLWINHDCGSKQDRSVKNVHNFHVCECHETFQEASSLQGLVEQFVSFECLGTMKVDVRSLLNCKKQTSFSKRLPNEFVSDSRLCSYRGSTASSLRRVAQKQFDVFIVWNRAYRLIQ